MNFRDRTNRYRASGPGCLVLCAFLLLIEGAGAHWPIPLNEAQREELQQFVDTASTQEVFERIDVDGLDFIRSGDANLYREEFLLKELVRRNTPEARRYIEKIYMPYLGPSGLDDGPWQANRIVCEAMVTLAELQTGGDEGERLKRYDALMQLQLDWIKTSLNRLHTMIAYRLIKMTSRESFDFLKKYEWHERYEFREILLDRIAVGLTREEQKAYIRRVVFENYDRFTGRPIQSGFTPFLAELHHLTGMIDQSLYQLILLIDEYEANRSGPKPNSAPMRAYLRLLHDAVTNSQRHAEFKNFGTIEPLYRADDAKGLRELAVKTENPYIKANIYEVYLRVDMKLRGLNETEQVAYLLGDKVLRGLPAVSIETPEEQDSPYGAMKDLELRSSYMIREYGLSAKPMVEEALNMSKGGVEQNAERVELLQKLLDTFTEMAKVRSKLFEQDAVPKQVLHE